MAEPRYVGNGWLKVFKNGGSIISCSVKVEDLASLPVDEYGCVRIVVGERKEKDPKSGCTHWVKVDDYFYQKQAENTPGSTTPRDADNQDLPY